MRICLDFDGVIANTAERKREWLASRILMDLTSIRYDRTSLEKIVGRQVYLEMQASVGFADTLMAEPQPGALKAIAALSQMATLFLITARAPEKMVWLRKWLDMKDLSQSFTGVFSSFGESKADILNYLEADFLVDDDERHLVDLPHRVCGILFCSSSDTSVPKPNISVARNWSEVLAIIVARRL